MVEIRYVRQSDRPFWYTLDAHLPETEFDEKVRTRQGYVLLLEGEPIGILRYNLFWDNTPFCNLLFIRADCQRHGYGRQLMEYWEHDMKRQGYDMVLTSTQSDEEAQHFYRRLGYRECGCLILDRPPHAQPMELFFVKDGFFT